MEKLLLTLIAGSAIGIIVLLVAYVFVTKKSNKIKKLSKQTKNRGKNRSRHLQKFYVVLNKRVYGAKLLHFFREPYELSSLYSEEQIRFRSIVVLLTMVLLTCLGLVVAAITGLKLSHIVILLVSVYLGSQSLRLPGNGEPSRSA